MKFQLAIVSMISVLSGLIMLFAGNMYGHIPLIVGGLLYIAITAPLNNLKPEQGKTRKRLKNGVMSILLLCTLTASAQTDKPVKEKPAKVLIAEETHMITTDKAVKIITSNEFIYIQLETRFPTSFKSLTRTPKTDRKGIYIQTTFNFPVSLQSEIVSFIKTLKTPN